MRINVAYDNIPAAAAVEVFGQLACHDVAFVVCEYLAHWKYY